MIRGTTPVHVFNTDIDLTEAEEMYITYKQYGQVVLEKTIDDISITSTKLTVYLSQEDTLKFGAADVEMQVRAKFPSGNTIVSNVITDAVTDILKEGAI